MEGRIWTVPPAASRPNPNSEGRNPKEGRIPKAEATLEHFGFRVSAFFRPSDFGLRVWAFALAGWWYCPDTPVMESPGAFSSTRDSDPEEYEPVLKPNSTGRGLKNVLLVDAVPWSAAYPSSHPLRDVYFWYARWLDCAIL